MKLEREIKLPNSKSIDVDLKLGDKSINFTIKPTNQIDKQALEKVEQKILDEGKAPIRAGEVSEGIIVSRALIESYEHQVNKESRTENPSLKKIDSIMVKKTKELELLQSLFEERATMKDTEYDVEPFYEEKARLYCTKGVDSLEKYVEHFSWREASYLIDSLLREADEKK